LPVLGRSACGNSAYRTFTDDDQNNCVQRIPEEVKNGSTVEESYLYDPDEQRVKKTAGSSNLYYPFTHYEIAGSTITKYYFFAGQRIAMNKGGTLTYLHSDHPSTSSGQALAALC